MIDTIKGRRSKEKEGDKERRQQEKGFYVQNRFTVKKLEHNWADLEWYVIKETP